MLLFPFSYIKSSQQHSFTPITIEIPPIYKANTVILQKKQNIITKNEYMRRSKIIVGLMSLMASATLTMPANAADAKEKTPAFPGAEGFGRYTTGGRGGKVYHVTTLEDSDKEGTFRWACNQKGARTIVFDVSGTIFLKSSLSLRNGDVTIAGQTAPGDGICIADYPFSLGCSNVILRYMRFRCGNRNVANHEGDGLGGMDLHDIIVDHCSVSWSIDECLSVYGSSNITVQWCIASQSLCNAGHSKGAHGYGGNWGGSGASYHHNLIAHHGSRTPRLGPRPSTQLDERMDMRNNVIYNWGGEGCYGGEGMNVNIINNYYKPGPTTLTRDKTRQMRIAAIGIRTTEYTEHNTNPNVWDAMWHVWGKFYVDGNVNTKYSEVTRDNWTYGIYNQINNSKVDNTYTAATHDTIKIDKPIDFMYVTTHDAATAYEKVLAYAGCSKSRDLIDAVIISDVTDSVATFTGDGCTPGLINNQNDAGGWPALRSKNPLPDYDNDGISDTWEDARGLDPSDPNDANIVGPDGYTNLEKYINSLVGTITGGQNKDGVVMGYTVNTDGTVVNGISHIAADKKNAASNTDKNIYFLNGTTAKANATKADYDSLAKGVYIHSGKKVVIK